jgi:NADH-quinone oxidoreductase subunit L
MSLKTTLLLIPLLPLAGAAIAGLLRAQVGRSGSHWVTIAGVGMSFLLSAWLLYQQLFEGLGTQNLSIYTWMVSDGIRFEVGFLLDHLTSTMMCVVTFVSLMVHIYTIGYMADDPGYQRFFSYIALFTFSMLMLVMANNFMQLFFGWEAVGLVSYLLIGFWFKKESAIFASLKAFLVNRVGDFGFLLGIAAVLYAFGSLDDDHSRARLANRHCYLRLPVHWRDGEISPGAIACLAAGFNGRPDTHFRIDSCGHNGDCRYFHGSPDVTPV